MPTKRILDDGVEAALRSRKSFAQRPAIVAMSCAVSWGAVASIASAEPSFYLGYGLNTAGGCAVELGDLNGDGNLDAAVGRGQFVKNEILLNNGTGGLLFDSSQPQMSIAGCFDLELDDFDNDGDLDLMTLDVGGPVNIYENIDGLFWVTTFARVYSKLGIDTGDLNGDGFVDFFAAGVDDRCCAAGPMTRTKGFRCRFRDTMKAC